MDELTGPLLDLAEPTSIHVVGVGGAGMSAIATVLAAMGHRVTGSDLKASAGLERLAVAGVEVAVGHDAANLGPDIAVVTRSTAVAEGNPEVVAARERGLPVLSRAEVLAAICGTRRTVAVAGTHGKTTTSSMLALVLREAGFEPSFIIGGDVNEIGSGAVWDGGEWFVVEADESDRTFLHLPREAAVVTNVEPDHLETYGGEEGLRAAFEQFVAETPGPVVCCADDPGARALVGEGVVTYGTAADATHRMVDLTPTEVGVRFGMVVRGREVGTIHLPVPGAHNARNAAAALATAVELGAAPDAAIAALERFGGVARRFERRGEAAGVSFVDDYAHLPTEVRAAIEAARSGPWARVVCVFQPHRYSRTALLWQDFAEAFRGADHLVVTDVYSSGEAPRPGVSGMLIVRAVLDADPWARVIYLPHRTDLVDFLERELRPGDCCLTLGAGDLTTLPDEVIERLDTPRRADPGPSPEVP